MHKNSTLENYSKSISKGRQKLNNGPSQEIIQGLIAYSKALHVLERPSDGIRRRKPFQLILN
jgi:hypothetical protein